MKGNLFSECNLFRVYNTCARIKLIVNIIKAAVLHGKALVSQITQR